MPTAAALSRARAAYGVVGGVIAVVVLVVGLLVGLGLVWSLLVALVLGGAIAAALYLGADAMALKALGAEPMAEGSRPRLENLLEGLTVAHGFRSPDVHLVQDSAPNAAVVGRSPSDASLVLTTGLLERLDRVELEGVLAHELMRIRTRQTVVNVSAATVGGRVLGFAPGLSRRVAGALLDTDAPVLTDFAGSGITRYPPGLCAALQSIHADGRTVATNPAAYRHLWLNPPGDAIAVQTFSIEDRIAVLQEL